MQGQGHLERISINIYDIQKYFIATTVSLQIHVMYNVSSRHSLEQIINSLFP